MLILKGIYLFLGANKYQLRPDYYIGGFAPKVERPKIVENKLAIPPMQEIIIGKQPLIVV